MLSYRLENSLEIAYYPEIPVLHLNVSILSPSWRYYGQPPLKLDEVIW